MGITSFDGHGTGNYGYDCRGDAQTSEHGAGMIGTGPF